MEGAGPGQGRGNESALPFSGVGLLPIRQPAYASSRRERSPAESFPGGRVVKVGLEPFGSTSEEMAATIAADKLNWLALKGDLAPATQ